VDNSPSGPKTGGFCANFPVNNVCVTFLKKLLFAQYVGAKVWPFPY
jgi:hypothetical protein